MESKPLPLLKVVETFNQQFPKLQGTGKEKDSEFFNPWYYIIIVAIYWNLHKVSMWILLPQTTRSILKVSETFPVAINMNNSVCGLTVKEHMPLYELTCYIIKNTNRVPFLITPEIFLADIIFSFINTLIDFANIYPVSIQL